MGTDRLSNPHDCGYVISYELTAQHLTVKLLGFIPLHRVRFTDIRYLRLASAREVPRWYFIRNWNHFLPTRASYCPVYILRTRSGNRRILLKLRSGAHFRLRRALGAHREATCKTRPVR